ncbi:transcriptional regulator, TetR family [Pseudobutyrivibrio sp. YE44]|uniref:TetR/AcrR family transcriptional regulator n=1 Tax=Pseudobutyrivibrio sp. YE44 TaxID=1520802 RepID=UPI00088FBF32|nr:TetR/AcrR family transcriptional regulator [Pseudobutyrivibrio sp. YE44]SDB12773.1 transcriptional regulator, TetR family [Pseudobutyrivibrio sp. YE44]
MARRKKEEAIVHQERIAEAAMELFKTKGISNTKMDEIAAAAGYGKATLYVYFKNKQEIISFLAYYSFSKLKDAIVQAVEVGNERKEIFLGVCKSIESFEKDYPDFFRMSLGNVTESIEPESKWAKFTYEVGEEINKIIIQYLEDGVSSRVFSKIDNYYEGIFRIWGMVSGLIMISGSKENYLKSETSFDREKFLEEGYVKIYETLLL